jgi:hypothetical protein
MKLGFLGATGLVCAGCICAAAGCTQNAEPSRVTPPTGPTGYVVTVEAATVAGLGACPDLGAVGLVTATIDGGVSYSLYYCDKHGNGLQWEQLACGTSNASAVAYVPSNPNSLLVCANQRWTSVPLPAGEAGPPGPPGPQGDAGGMSLVSVSTVAPGVTCPTGGEEIATGIDTNDNGVLDPGEIQSTAYVCNGVGSDVCATNNGYCDPHTQCIYWAGARTCGPCPVGYSGDGIKGCVNLCANQPNGASCGTDLVCDKGACNFCAQGAQCSTSNPCHVGSTDCSTGTPVCVDTGAAVADGNYCGRGEVCTAGACGCSSGLAQCSGYCADTQNDPSNCGSCSNTCGGTGLCRAGKCPSFLGVSALILGGNCGNGSSGCIAGGCNASSGWDDVELWNPGWNPIDLFAASDIGAGPGDWGGAYAVIGSDSGCTISGCYLPNQYTSACSCPSGWTDIALTADHGCGTYMGCPSPIASDSAVHFCWNGSVPLYTFGGAYEVFGGSCQTPNPATGGCSCPSGTSPTTINLSHWNGSQYVAYSLNICSTF